MPQAVAIPLITSGLTAAGVIGGAAMSASANKRATNAQSKAAADALAYEREREAAAERRRTQAMDAYKAALGAWYGRVGDKGISRYGMPAGLTIPGPAQPGKAYAPFVGGAMPAVPAGPAAPAAPNVSSLTGGVTALAPQPQTLADLPEWNDWDQYLQKGASRGAA